jgi:hexosaminidase
MGSETKCAQILQEKTQNAMRTLLIVLISTSIGLLPACQTSGHKSGTFNLLPQPEVVEFYGSSDIFPDSLHFYRLTDGVSLPVPPEYIEGLEETSRISGLQIVFEEDKSLALREDGYMLNISREQVTITGDKKAGRFYGYMTLLQLMSDAREQGLPLPKCHIEDAPKLMYRAIHLDMKHHMEKTEYYYELIDQLARYKINAVIAEVEDKLGYQRQPVVASEDALSMKEWKKLSEYAKDRYIEISPLVQGLGHASYILKHDQYKYLRDDPASDWAFNPLLPETYEVQFDLYRDALKAIPKGDYLHVGGDEVHTTGRGSGKSELELQLIWLNKVCAFADENGRTPIFWDDMPLKYAGLYNAMFDTRYTKRRVDSLWKENEPKLLEYLDLFPKNCIYMRWNYSHPETAGNIKAMEWFTEQGFDVMGATAGQTRWVLMPQNESNMDNIRSFANTSIDKEIEGLLLTLWDDDSPHFELYMRGILAFAEYSWSGDQRSKAEIKAAYRHREYAIALSAEQYGFVDQLEEAVGWWNTALLKSDCRNEIREMEDPAEEAVIDLPFSGGKEEWIMNNSLRLQNAAKAMRKCNTVAAVIDTMKLQTKRNLYRLEIYEQVNNLVRFSGQALFDLQNYAIAQPGQEEQEALAVLQQLPQEFNTLRAQLEEVYSRTRILSKPEGYLLDQDRHHHLANQSINFDWQFGAEMWFLEKMNNQINTLVK